MTDTEREVRVDPDAQARHHQPADHRSRRSADVRWPSSRRTTPASGYGDFKADVAEIVVDLVTPIRERYAEIVADEAGLDKVLADGAERAAVVARTTMASVRERVGFLPLRR